MYLTILDFLLVNLIVKWYDEFRINDMLNQLYSFVREVYRIQCINSVEIGGSVNYNVFHQNVKD
jgi:hypothetical protein